MDGMSILRDLRYASGFGNEIFGSWNMVLRRLDDLFDNTCKLYRVDLEFLSGGLLARKQWISTEIV
jgi:hypothetical protein